jgi:hypothetical protein
MFSLATSETFAIGHLVALYKHTDSVYDTLCGCNVEVSHRLHVRKQKFTRTHIYDP